MKNQGRHQADKPTVVIVGAGFAGMAAADALSAEEVDVVVVDRNTYHTFQPLLYQVATGGLNPGDVAYPVRATVRQYDSTRFRLGTLTGIDWGERRVFLEEGDAVAYDYLILAMGASTNFFGVPGAEDHALAIYSIGQAIEARDRVYQALEQAVAEPENRPVSIVVVGGGATGVEMAGALAELRNSLVPLGYPELTPADVRIILVERLDRLLTAFKEGLAHYALAQLADRGVDLDLGTSVSEVHNDSVRLSDNRVLAPAIVLWAAGVKAPDVTQHLGVPLDKSGRIQVAADLHVPDHEGVFVLGDLAALPSSGPPVPQMAQPAIQQGHHAARQIHRMIRAEPLLPFVYRDKGMMATIGRRAAVVQLARGVTMTGTSAWLAWLGLHLVALLGNRNRFSVLTNLSWRYVKWPRGVKVIAGS